MSRCYLGSKYVCVLKWVICVRNWLVIGWKQVGYIEKGSFRLKSGSPISKNGYELIYFYGSITSLLSS